MLFEVSLLLYKFYGAESDLQKQIFENYRLKKFNRGFKTRPIAQGKDRSVTRQV